MGDTASSSNEVSTDNQLQTVGNKSFEPKLCAWQQQNKIMYLVKQGNLTDTIYLQEKVFRHDQGKWIILPGGEASKWSCYHQGYFGGPKASDNLLDYHIVNEKSQIDLLMVLLACIF